MVPLLILVVGGNPDVWEFVHDTLSEDGHLVDRARDERDAAALLALRTYDLLLAEIPSAWPDPAAPRHEFARPTAAAPPRQILVLTPGSGGRAAKMSARPGVAVLRLPLTPQDLRDAVIRSAPDRGEAKWRRG